MDPSTVWAHSSLEITSVCLCALLNSLCVSSLHVWGHVLGWYKENFRGKQDPFLWPLVMDIITWLWLHVRQADCDIYKWNALMRRTSLCSFREQSSYKVDYNCYHTCLYWVEFLFFYWSLVWVCDWTENKQILHSVFFHYLSTSSMWTPQCLPPNFNMFPSLADSLNLSLSLFLFLLRY